MLNLVNIYHGNCTQDHVSYLSSFLCYYNFYLIFFMKKKLLSKFYLSIQPPYGFSDEENDDQEDYHYDMFRTLFSGNKLKVMRVI